MKDLYSFHSSAEDLKKYYQTVMEAYLKIFNRIGFADVKITEASGGSFTKKFSHEFNVLTPAGEVDLLYCDSCQFAQNQEIASVKIDSRCPRCQKGKIKFGKAIEIGNIFDLGTRFSDSFDLKFIDKDGVLKPVFMGCYGIGISRILGALVEIYHDKNGIIWPKSIAPFQMHLAVLDSNNREIRAKANNLYQKLIDEGYAVLYDDRDNISPGEKLTDADLIGIPIRLVISKKTGDRYEYKERVNNKIELLDLNKILKKI
jgi:prolyl-tRNA synthetase